MSEAGEAFLYWEQANEWFQRSAGLFESLSASCVAVESILVGVPADNLATAKLLSAHTHDAELALLTDPCPDQWGARQLHSIVATLSEIGHDVVMAFGDPQGRERVLLAAKVDSARRMVTELERLAARLLSSGSP